MPGSLSRKRAGESHVEILRDLSEGDLDARDEIAGIFAERIKNFLFECGKVYQELFAQAGRERDVIWSTKEGLLAEIEIKNVRRRRLNARRTLCSVDVSTVIGSYIEDVLTMFNFATVLEVDGVTWPFLTLFVQKMSQCIIDVLPEISLTLLREWCRLDSVDVSKTDAEERLGVSDLNRVHLMCGEQWRRFDEDAPISARSLLVTGIVYNGREWWLKYLTDPVVVSGDQERYWLERIGVLDPPCFSSSSSCDSDYGYRDPLKSIFKKLRNHM